MEENQQGSDLKRTVDNILGVSTFIKVRRKTKEDVDREKFLNIVFQLDQANVRSILLENDFKLGFGTYNEIFFNVIDELLEVSYGKDATDIILWYIYDRYNADGTINTLADANGNEFFCNTPLELWKFIIPMLKEYKSTKKGK